MNDTASNANVVRITIAFCVLTSLCEGIDLQAAGVAAGGIIGEFSPAPDKLGTFFSASTFGLFFGAIIGGRIADVIGRKKVLTTSVALFGLFSLLTPLAWDITTLSFARLVTGLGLGGAMPMVIAMVSETASAKRQSAAVAMVYSATPIGGAIASLVSLLIAAPQWRWIFVLGGVLPLLVAPLMFFRLDESAAFRDAKQRALLAGAAGTPVLKSGSFAAIFGGGRALTTLLLWVSFFLALLLLYLLLNWLPTLLVSDGLSRLQAAGAQIGFNIGGALAALLIGYLLGGRLRNAAIILTFVALPLLLLALAKAPAELTAIMGMVFLLGCAVIAAQAFLYAMAPVAYPVAIRGVGVGAAVAMGRIGSIVGPKLGGVLKAAGHGPTQLLMDLLPIVILGSICALCFAWYTRRAGAAAPAG
jgi:MFS transporter, AAHS family, 3-hydroxyphenylpropionic acid transporter